MIRHPISTLLISATLLFACNNDGEDPTTAGETSTSDTATTSTSTSTSTSGAATTIASDSTAGETDSGGTTSSAPVCGNGVLEVGEECDDGASNADDAACTTACVAATRPWPAPLYRPPAAHSSATAWGCR